MSRSVFRNLTVFFLSVVLVTGVGWVMPEDSEARKIRNATRTSVHRDRHVNRNVNRNVDRNVRRDRNTNINIDRDIDIDVDRDYRHPVGTAVGVAAATAVTAAVIGSIVYSLPPSCQQVVVGGYTYQQCGNTWYQPQYAGSQVTYVVVNSPY